jgi:dephospho-CoA kinase
VVVCDVPLLFENGMEGEFDLIILVDAPRELRLARIERDRGLAHAEAVAMVDAQQPSAGKRARAQYVIDNDDTLETLRARLDTVWHAIQHDHLS